MMESRRSVITILLVTLDVISPCVRNPGVRPMVNQANTSRAIGQPQAVYSNAYINGYSSNFYERTFDYWYWNERGAQFNRKIDNLLKVPVEVDCSSIQNEVNLDVNKAMIGDVDFISQKNTEMCYHPSQTVPTGDYNTQKNTLIRNICFIRAMNLRLGTQIPGYCSEFSSDDLNPECALDFSYPSFNTYETLQTPYASCNSKKIFCMMVRDVMVAPKNETRTVKAFLQKMASDSLANEYCTAINSIVNAEFNKFWQDPMGYVQTSSVNGVDFLVVKLKCSQDLFTYLNTNKDTVCRGMVSSTEEQTMRAGYSYYKDFLKNTMTTNPQKYFCLLMYTGMPITAQVDYGDVDLKPKIEDAFQDFIKSVKIPSYHQSDTWTRGQPCAADIAAIEQGRYTEIQEPPAFRNRLVPSRVNIARFRDNRHATVKALYDKYSNNSEQCIASNSSGTFSTSKENPVAFLCQSRTMADSVVNGRQRTAVGENTTNAKYTEFYNILKKKLDPSIYTASSTNTVTGCNYLTTQIVGYSYQNLTQAIMARDYSLMDAILSSQKKLDAFTIEKLDNCLSADLRQKMQPLCNSGLYSGRVTRVNNRFANIGQSGRNHGYLNMYPTENILMLGADKSDPQQALCDAYAKATGLGMNRWSRMFDMVMIAIDELRIADELKNFDEAAILEQCSFPFSPTVGRMGIDDFNYSFYTPKHYYDSSKMLCPAAQAHNRLKEVCGQKMSCILTSQIMDCSDARSQDQQRIVREEYEKIRQNVQKDPDNFLFYDALINLKTKIDEQNFGSTYSSMGTSSGLLFDTMCATTAFRDELAKDWNLNSESEKCLVTNIINDLPTHTDSIYQSMYGTSPPLYGLGIFGLQQKQSLAAAEWLK